MPIQSTATHQNILTSLRTFAVYCIERDTLLRSIKTGLVIGTLLALINHGQEFLAGQFTLHQIIPILLTYLVPFAVATFGQVRGKRQRDLLQVNSGTPLAESEQTTV